MFFAADPLSNTMADDLRITPSEAQRRLQAGAAIVLDVVQPNSWADLDRVVAGSLRMPPDDVERRYGEVSANREIIAYCTDRRSLRAPVWRLSFGATDSMRMRLKVDCGDVQSWASD